MGLKDSDVMKSFEKTKGVLKGHFILTSGRHADTYMQCARLFTDAKESEKLCGELGSRLKKYGADIVVSPAVGGIIMGYEVSRQLGIPNIFTERADGKMTLRRGFELPKGSKVVVIEDVVTTGGSVKEVIDYVNQNGSSVVAVGSIVDRSNGQTTFGVPYEALLTLEVLSYEASECPLCKQGLVAEKPGSRSLK